MESYLDFDHLSLLSVEPKTHLGNNIYEIMRAICKSQLLSKPRRAQLRTRKPEMVCQRRKKKKHVKDVVQAPWYMNFSCGNYTWSSKRASVTFVWSLFIWPQKGNDLGTLVLNRFFVLFAFTWLSSSDICTQDHRRQGFFNITAVETFNHISALLNIQKD